MYLSVSYLLLALATVISSPHILVAYNTIHSFLLVFCVGGCTCFSSICHHLPEHRPQGQPHLGRAIPMAKGKEQDSWWKHNST